MDVNKTGYGDESNIKISEDVLAKIATTAAMDVPGVAGFASIQASQGVKRALGKKGEARGISLSYENGEAIVDLFINVTYGSVVREVALSVQEKVKEAIEMMTGILVSAIHVNIVGLVLENEQKKKHKKAE